MKIENEEFSNEDIEQCEDIIQLLEWKMNQLVRVSITEMSLSKKGTVKSRQYFIAQDALLKILDAKISILNAQNK